MNISLSNKEKSLIKQYMLGATVFGLVFMGYILLIAFNNYSVIYENFPAIIDIHLQNPTLFIGWAFVISFILLAKFLTTRFLVKRKEVDKVVEKQNRIITNNALFAKSIGEGDYSTDKVEDVEQKDLLTKSLYKMRANLVKNSEKEKNQIWVNEGKELVSDVLRQYHDFEELSYNVLKELLDYTDIVQGAVYIWDEEKKVFEQKATHAYNRKKYVHQTFKTGEGLIGAAAFEQLPIYRTEIPEDFATMTSGLIEDKKPGSIFIVPLISNEEVLGILEVSAVSDFIDEIKRTLILEIAPIMGQTLFSLKVNHRTNKLLEESRALTQELQENEEELQQNAEEMRMTHEELESTNIELEKQIKEVESSKTRLNSLLENASEVISIFNKRGAIIYESPSTKNIFGYEPEEVIGKQGIERVANGFEDVVQENFKKLIENPYQVVRYKFKHMTKTGESIWVETTGRNMLDNDAISGIIFNTRDITLQRMAEKEKRAKGQMQALSENSQDSIIRFDKKFNILYQNPSSKQIIKNSNGKKKLKELNLKTEIEEFLIKNIKDVIKSQTITNVDFDLKTNGEIAYYQFSIIPEYNDEKEFESILFVGHDITDIVKIEKEISEKNKKLTESINYAERIQKSIIPTIESFKEHFNNFCIINKARDVVSGDLPWNYQNDKFEYIAAIDCTGHGVPGALLSFVSHFQLNDTVKELPEANPAELLTSLDKKVKQSLKQNRNGSETRDGMDIGLCKIDKENMELFYSGAHRPLYHQRGNELNIVKGCRRSIGGIYGKRYLKKEFKDEKIKLQKGDRIFVFSDGLPDQFNSKLEKFQNKRIRDLILQHKDKDLQKFETILNEELLKWQGNYRQIDDILFLGIEI